MVSIVQERDRHLCGVLSEVRWLDVSRVKKLMPGRVDGEVRNALGRMTKEPRQLFAKHQWMSRRGLESVYSLTEMGAYEAARLFDREVEVPPGEPNAQTLEHHLGCVDIYLSLLTAAVSRRLEKLQLESVEEPGARRRLLQNVYASAIHPGWRWTMAAVATRLPWQQATSAQLFDRHLEPDAVVEFPRANNGVGARSFLEFETGSHTLHANNPNKPNATEAKLRRYAQFLTLKNPVTGRTWYASKYSDNFIPDVTLVEPSERRVKNVEALVAAWAQREHRGREPFKVRVLTPDGVAKRYALLSGGATALSPTPVVMSAREAAAMKEFLEAARSRAATEFGSLPRADSVATFLNRLKET